MPDPNNLNADHPADDESGQELWTEFEVTPETDKMRIDVLLVSRLATVSRSRINTAIRRGLVWSADRQLKPSDRLVAGSVVRFRIPEPPPSGLVPENVPLDILHEDDWIAVINKPAGMVVHPARGHWAGTLTAALAFHFSQLSGAGGPLRPGIVHRLDRDTSGVILAAKTDQAHAHLTDQFQNRVVEKEYFAIVTPPPGRDRDQIDRPIGVHPYQREKMMIRDDHSSSREAQTFYEVRERMGRFAMVAAFPKTGRTHQIRVHLASIGCPCIADRLYSGRGWIVQSEVTGRIEDTARLLERQALHARRIRFRHPRDGAWVEFEAPLPEDLSGVVALLQQHHGQR